MISPFPPPKMPSWITHENTHDSQLESIDEYSHYCIYKLWKHVKTQYCLIIHADGYILHPNQWDSQFLSYDYIGAPWKIRNNAYIDPFGKHQRVGNGGFSLRSQRTLNVPNQDEVPWNVNSGNFYKHMDAQNFAEDGNICVHNRHIYERNGVKFAPLTLALKFSVEQKVEEYRGEKTFGFHKKLPTLSEKVKDKLLRWIYRIYRRATYDS